MNDAAYSRETWCLIYVCKWRSHSPIFARSSRSICTNVYSWDELLKLQGASCQLPVFLPRELVPNKKEQKPRPRQQTGCTRAPSIVCISYRLLASSGRRVSAAAAADKQGQSEQRMSQTCRGKWREL